MSIVSQNKATAMQAIEAANKKIWEVAKAGRKLAEEEAQEITNNLQAAINAIEALR